jgi:TRAP-type transport system small permease protein
MIARLYFQVLRAEAIVAGVLLAAMVVLIFMGGVARSLGHPLNWTIDFATCFFAWATFLAADVAWRNGGLISINLLTERLPPRVRRTLTYLNCAIISAFLVYLVIAGTWLSWVSRARSFQGIAGISYSWVTMSLPVGALLLLVTTVLKARDFHRGVEPSAPPGAGA